MASLVSIISFTPTPEKLIKMNKGKGYLAGFSCSIKLFLFDCAYPYVSFPWEVNDCTRGNSL